MKTTVEIADALFEQTRKTIRERRITFRAFLEESLRKNLQASSPPRPFRLRKASFRGQGLLPGWDWSRIRREVYKGRGE